MRAVAVQTNRFRADRNPRAIDGLYALLTHHRQRLVERGIFAVDQGTRRAAFDERAVRVVPAIGKHLFLGLQAKLARGLDQLTARQTKHDERRIEITDRAHDGDGQRPVTRSLVVQRAMRLHVGELAALRAHDGRQPADLEQHARVDFIRREVHFSAAEVFAIRKTRMRADRYALA